jgi:hypothetical protein
MRDAPLPASRSKICRSVTETGRGGAPPPPPPPGGPPGGGRGRRPPGPAPHGGGPGGGAPRRRARAGKSPRCERARLPAVAAPLPTDTYALHDDAHGHDPEDRPAVPAQPRRGAGGARRGVGRPGAAVDTRATGQTQASTAGVTLLALAGPATATCWRRHQHASERAAQAEPRGPSQQRPVLRQEGGGAARSQGGRLRAR